MVATKLQEAATAMCHEDIRTRLCDSLNDAFRGTGNWAYVVAVFGDDKAGDVVYSVNSDLKKAAYTIAVTGAATINTAAAVDVQPLTTYEVESVMSTEAGARHSKRDVMQLQTIHDASAALGANCSMAEAKKPSQGAGLKLVESFDFAEAETLTLLESAAGTIEREIKIISPGRGSSAIYTEEVLKRDAPKVFQDKTQIYVNHATKAEEAARPEGDWHKLVGALKGAAYWKESGKYGKGAYAMAEFAAEDAPLIFTKAPWSGMSIRANGNALTEGGRVVMQDGLPILKEFTHCESIDIVTRPGAGGMILSESARAAEIPTQEAAMAGVTSEEATKLIEAAVAKATAPYQQRLLRSDAKEEAAGILRTVSLPEPAKARIIERAITSVPTTAEGALDLAKFRESVVAEAKSEGEYLASLNPNAGRVNGFGLPGSVIVPPTAEQVAAREAQATREFEDEVKIYERQGMNRKAAEFAARGREEDAA